MTTRMNIQQLRKAQKKKPKYRNKKKTVDGIEFDSMKEANRYCVLKLLAFAGEIQELKLQESFAFALNGVKICSYDSDFSYIRKGQKIVEDTKSPSTRKNRAYRIKVKMMKAFYGIEILET